MKFFRRTESFYRRVRADPIGAIALAFQNITQKGHESIQRPFKYGKSITKFHYKVVAVWPHDTTTYTQGLVYCNGKFFESSGLHGQSCLREVETETGRVLREVRLHAEFFAEGIAAMDGKIFQLTWDSHLGFVYDTASLRVVARFRYLEMGWGLTTDGNVLIMSNGTDRIQFRDPKTFVTRRTIKVSCNGCAVWNLNDLEYIKGEIFANIYKTDYVVRIDPVTGAVLGVVDFGNLLDEEERRCHTGVLNGIAYDQVGDRLFVTGKQWPKVFEVCLRTEHDTSAGARDVFDAG